MNPKAPLHFEFSPSKDDTARGNGWGYGILYVQGIPYWYSKSDAEPQPFKWTWVDLLEHVASNWWGLVYDQPYPYPWLNEAAHPGDLWSIAERRWAKLGENVAEAEETALLSYERQHNLAYAWKGLSLPALTFVRNGSICWLCAEGLAPIRAQFEDCRKALISVCDTLAQAFDKSTNPRVVNAVKLWRHRGAGSLDNFFRLVTGLDQDSLIAVQGGADPFEFWDLDANDSLVDGLIEQGPLLAAARMTAGILDNSSIRRIIDAIRAIPKGSSCDALNRLTSVVRQSRRSPRTQFAFAGGYDAANIARRIILQSDRAVWLDIDAVFNQLGIGVHKLSLDTDKIDAVAVWGARGPCVILNEDRKHKEPERTRMTLAHELGHLILDREGGLPFCEVLGGAVDYFVEQRANAFAAELLLPRGIVEQRNVTRKGPIGDFVLSLKQDFVVSKSVACAQIFNSSVFARISRQEQEFVELRLRRVDEIGSQHDIPVQSGGDVML